MKVKKNLPAMNSLTTVDKPKTKAGKVIQVEVQRKTSMTLLDFILGAFEIIVGLAVYDGLTSGIRSMFK